MNLSSNDIYIEKLLKFYFFLLKIDQTPKIFIFFLTKNWTKTGAYCQIFFKKPTLVLSIKIFINYPIVWFENLRLATWDFSFLFNPYAALITISLLTLSSIFANLVGLLNYIDFCSYWFKLYWVRVVTPFFSVSLLSSSLSSLIILLAISGISTFDVWA